MTPFSISSPKPAETAEGIKINLNDHGRTTLTTNFGLSESFAKDLIKERNKNGSFTSIELIESRMEKYYKAENVPKDSKKFDDLYDQTDILRKKTTPPSNLEIK